MNMTRIFSINLAKMTFRIKKNQITREKDQNNKENKMNI